MRAQTATSVISSLFATLVFSCGCSPDKSVSEENGQGQLALLSTPPGARVTFQRMGGANHVELDSAVTPDTLTLEHGGYGFTFELPGYEAVHVGHGVVTDRLETLNVTFNKSE